MVQLGPKDQRLERACVRRIGEEMAREGIVLEEGKGTNNHVNGEMYLYRWWEGWLEG